MLASRQLPEASACGVRAAVLSPEPSKTDRSSAFPGRPASDPVSPTRAPLAGRRLSSSSFSRPPGSPARLPSGGHAVTPHAAGSDRRCGGFASEMPQGRHQCPSAWHRVWAVPSIRLAAGLALRYLAQRRCPESSSWELPPQGPASSPFTPTP